MPDKDTIAVYDASVARYQEVLKNDPQKRDRDAFLASLPPKGPVLDLGCGPGLDAAAMAAAGRSVEAWDASPAMAEAAAQHPGVTARCATFAELAGAATANYAGIWAAFSLLHAPRADLPGLIQTLRRVLTPGAPLFLAMKLGSGERRDNLGRLYSYVSEAELTDWLTQAGFTLTRRRIASGQGLAGTSERFITVFANA